MNQSEKKNHHAPQGKACYKPRARPAIFQAGWALAVVAIAFQSWRIYSADVSASMASPVRGGAVESNDLLPRRLAQQFSTTISGDAACDADALVSQLRTELSEPQGEVFFSTLLDRARALRIDAESSPVGQWKESSELFRICAECYFAGGRDSPEFVENAADSFVVAGDLRQKNGNESRAQLCYGRAVKAYDRALELLADPGSQPGDMARRIERKRGMIQLLIEVPSEPEHSRNPLEIEA